MRAALMLFAAFLVLLGVPQTALAASLEQMAGQMVLVGFRGQHASATGVVAVREALAAGQIGGVMYLKTNVASLAAVRKMNQGFASAGALPALIALDQEGGRIERLTNAVGFEEISSAARIAATETPQQARAIYGAMAKRLAGLGFTLNFGPVVDLNINPSNPIIARYGRAFGADAELVAAYAGAFVAGHRAANVLTALKHFPGHGSSTSDSHEGFVDITQSWQINELEPYRALIKAGLVDMVMVGHLYHQKLADGAEERLPASLSPNWIEGGLRRQLGYDGVVISDDLEMGAIRKHWGLRETIVKSVMAGTDILLFSNTANYSAGLGARIQAILVAEAIADPVFLARIEESYKRIVALKSQMVR